MTSLLIDPRAAEAGDAAAAEPTPVYAVAQADDGAAFDDAPPAARAYAEAVGFKGALGEVALAPRGDGAGLAVLVGVGADSARDRAQGFGAAAARAPAGDYCVASLAGVDPLEASLAWAGGAYAFTRYKPRARPPARLIAPQDADFAELSRLSAAITLARDLINTPAADMGPEALEAAARRVAAAAGGEITVTVGEDLLTANYPLIHAVGRGAAEAPRLIELTWGEPDHPPVAIVGKGVCFDTGGLNIKPGDFMRLMKKDMGGAAHALALAQLVMDAKLPCRLHTVIPAVENAVSRDAFRPGDILASRAGLTVEIENTDAEGRLVLADALTRAQELEPTLVIDYATLTGAARVALGPDLAPYYANDDAAAADLEAAAAAAGDPVWRMPLWPGYRSQVESPIADLKNLGDGPMGGSILAALFLERFAGDAPWVHFDVYAWSPSARAGRPKGGAAQGLRAGYGLLTKRLHSG